MQQYHTLGVPFLCKGNNKTFKCGKILQLPLPLCSFKVKDSVRPILAGIVKLMVVLY